MATPAAKRIIDVVVASLLSVLTAPLVVVLAMLSTLVHRSSPFFVQTRIGRHGEPFQLIKIRSLPPGTAPSLDKYELQRATITRFGGFLRRTHLDELPQLWLVSKGTMSLVGPRPEMPHLAARFSDAQARARSPFRPGCTGLWQVSPDRAGLMYETPKYDLMYARHCSLRLDALILWHSVLLLVCSASLDPTRLDDGDSVVTSEMPTCSPPSMQSAQADQ